MQELFQKLASNQQVPAKLEAVPMNALKVFSNKMLAEEINAAKGLEHQIQEVQTKIANLINLSVYSCLIDWKTSYDVLNFNIKNLESQKIVSVKIDDETFKARRDFSTAKMRAFIHMKMSVSIDQLI